MIILWYHHNNATTKFTCSACTFAFFLRGGTSTLISFSSSKLYSSITSRETNPSMSPEKNVGSSNTTGVHFRFLVFLFLSAIAISVLFRIKNKSTPYTLLSGKVVFCLRPSAIVDCFLGEDWIEFLIRMLSWVEFLPLTVCRFAWPCCMFSQIQLTLWFCVVSAKFKFNILIWLALTALIKKNALSLSAKMRIHSW